MAKSLSKRDNFSKIIVGTLGVAFVLILGVLMYAATSTNTDLRSKAALEEKVYKQWNFSQDDLQGWDIKSLGRSRVTAGADGVLFTADSKGVVLTNKEVNVQMDKGQKNLKFAMKLDNSVPPVSEGGPAGSMPSAGDAAALTINGVVEYKLAGKRGSEKNIKISGAFNGEKGIFTASFPQIASITIAELTVTLKSNDSRQVVLNSIVLSSPVMASDPTPQCKTGLNSLAGNEECGSGKYRYMTFGCYDGFTGRIGGPSECKTTEAWAKEATPLCEGRSSCTPTGKLTPTPGVGPATPLPTTKTGGGAPGGFACIQVLTPARNSKTGACQTYSSPCSIPAGWVADASCPTAESGSR